MELHRTTFDFPGILTSFFAFLWSSFLLLAPMLLLGLLLSGLIHVFISRQAILRWLRDDSLKSVTLSSTIGVPRPLCSCSVVPVVAGIFCIGLMRDHRDETKASDHDHHQPTFASGPAWAIGTCQRETSAVTSLNPNSRYRKILYEHAAQST